MGKFPRIMINRAVMQDIKSAGSSTGDLLKFAFQANDGPYSVNLLEQADNETPEGLRAHLLPRLKVISATIATRLDEATDNPNHFEKVQWFARYWNSQIPKWASGECLISGPGLESSVTL